MTLDGIVPSALLCLVSVFGGAWARSLSRTQAELRTEMQALRKDHETEVRASVDFRADARVRIRALEKAHGIS